MLVAVVCVFSTKGLLELSRLSRLEAWSLSWFANQAIIGGGVAVFTLDTLMYFIWEEMFIGGDLPLEGPLPDWGPPQSHVVLYVLQG